VLLCDKRTYNIMNYLDAFLYGAIQGITEYLPISSSAHLILLPRFFNLKDPGLTFDVLLHFGTMMATIIYFWRDWMDVAYSVPGLNKYRKGNTAGVSWKLITVATIPALIVGAGLNDWVETVFRSNGVVATTLVMGGVLLFLADYFAVRNKNLKVATVVDALWVGIAQCFALVPGVSRSGATMIGGRLLGFTRQDAARFSFLISAPVTAAAVVYEMRNWDKLFTTEWEIGPLLFAGFSAFLFGCLAIGGLLRLLRRFGYLSFAVYRIILAVTILKFLGV